MKNSKDQTADPKAIMASAPLTDVHTHIYDPALGNVLLWGIDELLTYHYLVAEYFRAEPSTGYDRFWSMTRTQQADAIWKTLFVDRSPVSEACRGVLTVMHKLGLDPAASSLREARDYFASTNSVEHVNRVFELAGISRVYMTNDPLDAAEQQTWLKGFDRDSRFLGVLRLDSSLMNWPAPVPALKQLGYDVEENLSGRTMSEIKRYLSEWCDRFDARYMAISLPPSFRYPDPLSPLVNFMTKVVFPLARERNIPTAMMIGVRKLANPELRLAGDSVGKSDIETVERIACDFIGNRFMITMLSRENMHELCIASRKFKNILPFGCWWFLNNPSLIREITEMRLETLGLSFIPQHSDARVLDQLIYKWDHSRRIIGEVLAGKYADLAAAGRPVSGTEVKRDINILFNSGI